jgi:cellulase/cellobiase CelA1
MDKLLRSSKREQWNMFTEALLEDARERDFRAFAYREEIASLTPDQAIGIGELEYFLKSYGLILGTRRVSDTFSISIVVYCLHSAGNCVS